MKQKITKFVLWLYLNHIKEDWDEYNKVGKIFIYPIWIIKSFFIWILFPLFIPAYLFSKSKIYLNFIEFQKDMSMEKQLEMIKTMRANQKVERNNFLIQKEKKGKYNKKF